MSADLTTPPRPEAFAVHELVANALRGRLRLPPFQRGLKWDAGDVSLLLDSLHRGYPIGSLLLWRGRAAPPGPAQLGPLVIDLPEADPSWVVDGQQRIVSLAASMTQKGAADPRFDQWFNPDDASFQKRPRGTPPPHWVPVWRLLDAADLGEFLLDWEPGTPIRRRTVLEAGRRLREFRVPATIVESESDEPVRVVFQRLNERGKSLLPHEIFDAWAAPGNTLASLAVAAGAAGWGRPDEDVLLRAVLVNEGRNPTIGLKSEQTVELERSTERVREGLLLAISFLRTDALVPHIALLPYTAVLQVLPAFFNRYPRPSARSRRLLVRWTWRLMTGGRPTDPTVLRACVRALAGNATEDATVQALMATVGEANAWAFHDVRFRSDSGLGRIALVALAHLGPMDLRTGAPLDLPALVESGVDFVQALFPADGSSLVSSIANRTLHPPLSTTDPDFPSLVQRWVDEFGVEAKPLASHAIGPAAANAIGDPFRFQTERARAIERVVNLFVKLVTAPDHSDRPDLRPLFGS